MKTGNYYWPLYILLICFAISCGAKEKPEMVVSGTLEGQSLNDNPDQPVLVAVMRDGSGSSMSTINLNGIEAMVSADTQNGTFEIDLTDSDLEEGDKINLVAFVDENYSQGLPNPDSGDKVGIYIDQESYSTTYTLKEGINSGFHIMVNRLIRPFVTDISGTLKGKAAGEAMIVAYAGDIDTLDFTSLDSDRVIGYSRQYKGSSDQPYSIELLPYPADLETEKVYILVLLDDTDVGLPAPGNLVGFHTDTPGTMPRYFSVGTGDGTHLTGIDVDLSLADASDALRIPEPCGDIILLNGDISLPSNFDENEGAVFLLVAKTDDPASIMKSPLSSISYFTKLPKGETSYFLDLSETGLCLHDEVMLIALWDRDYQSGFPDPTPGDVIGYLSNKKEMAYSMALSNLQGSTDIPEGWDLSLNKVIYDHHASIAFQIDQNAAIVPQPGEAILAIAMTAKGLFPLDPAVEYTLDMDYVVGMQRFIVGQDGPPYSLDILPAIYRNEDDEIRDIQVSENPFGLNGIYLLGLLDNNPANGVPDEDEYLGYCQSSKWGMPLRLHVQDGVNTVEQPITFPGAWLTMW